jgi:hypothetical protein
MERREIGNRPRQIEASVAVVQTATIGRVRSITDADSERAYSRWVMKTAMKKLSDRLLGRRSGPKAFRIARPSRRERLARRLTASE